MLATNIKHAQLLCWDKEAALGSIVVSLPCTTYQCGSLIVVYIVFLTVLYNPHPDGFSLHAKNSLPRCGNYQCTTLLQTNFLFVVKHYLYLCQQHNLFVKNKTIAICPGGATCFSNHVPSAFADEQSKRGNPFSKK